MEINKKDVTFEIDTGCCLTVMSEETFKETWRHNSLRPIKIKLETYTGDPAKEIGATLVRVRYQRQTKNLPLIVGKGDSRSLLGQGWLEHIYLGWREIKNRCKARKVQTTVNTLEQVLNRHKDMFKEELGTLKGTKATVRVKQDATPSFFHSRSVPFAM